MEYLQFSHRANPQVLIADDDSQSLLRLTNAVRSLDYCVIGCAMGRQAVQLLRRHESLRAVILNWMLPDMDGHEVTRHIKEHFPLVATIVVVGKAFVDDARALIGAEADVVLAKLPSGIWARQEVAEALYLASTHRRPKLKDYPRVPHIYHWRDGGPRQCR